MLFSINWGAVGVPHKGNIIQALLIRDCSSHGLSITYLGARGCSILKSIIDLCSRYCFGSTHHFDYSYAHVYLRKIMDD